jgi:hypothetical protein
MTDSRQMFYRTRGPKLGSAADGSGSPAAAHPARMLEFYVPVLEAEGKTTEFKIDPVKCIYVPDTQNSLRVNYSVCPARSYENCAR